MARPIDGDALKRWCEKIIDQACHPATVQIGEVFLSKLRSMPTLPQPSNEALTLEYREYRCAECGHEWMEDCDATDYPNYCPGCGNELRRPPEGEK